MDEWNNQNETTDTQKDGLRLASGYTEEQYQNLYRQDADTYYGPGIADSVREVERKSISDVMAGAFFYMFIALIVTGITAMIIANSPSILMAIFQNSITVFAFIIGEMVVVYAAGFAMRKNQLALSAILFFVYAVLNGVTFSIIFIAYTATSIQQAFLMTAIMFGVMAFIGKTTHKDLTSLGSILLIGLIAVIIVSVVNIFIGSTMLELGLSVITIVIFLGLTAYDVQKIERLANANSSYSVAVLSLYGALELYLDFINIFLRVIRLMGKRK